jgi:protein gp70
MIVQTSHVLDSGVILDVPNWLRVWYERSSANSWSIFVYVSVMVSPSRRMFRPVREIIEEYQAQLVHEETVDDEMVMGFRAYLRQYTVSGPCPWPANGVPASREGAG